jgi:ribonuclease E
MLDDENSTTTESPETTTTPASETEAAAPAKKTAARKTAAKKTAAKKAPAKKTAARKAAAAPAEASAEAGADAVAEAPDAEGAADTPAAPARKTAARKTAAKKTAATKTADTKTAATKTAATKTAAKKTTAKKAAPKKQAEPQPELELALEEPTEEPVVAEEEIEVEPGAAPAASVPPVALLFKAPEAAPAPRRTRKAAAPKPAPEPEAEAEAEATPAEEPPAPKRTRTRQPKAKPAPEPEAEVEEAETEEAETEAETGEGEAGAARRRRRRGGRRRRKPSDGEGEAGDENDEDEAESGESAAGDDTAQAEAGGTRRRRVRVRAGEAGGQGSDEANTVTRVRQTRSAEDQITSVAGSTRLEAKKQRRREGREAGRRRAPIVSEAEFLARRESVDRVMAIRHREDLTQIAVLEDKVLVEHYVARESQTSLIGNVYIGRVQNVLPSMEAAFIDIGKGRNAVLYAGEVNWSALGHKDGQPRKIESVLSSGQSVLVQVTKDPVGHKGARLTSQVSLAGRFLVYVPDGTTSGISRKLPDTERTRLKTLLKEIVPDTAGVIVRTAAEGASEEELTHDVERLKARWDDIEKQAKNGSAPKLLYGEPDLTLKVVRDLFTEDFGTLVIQGDEAWETVQEYVAHVAPDLQDRLERYDAAENGDVFAAYRIDEQIAKGLDRKVWLPSGGSLIIDRTEAMTVVDVNTGKFTGSGGNLEETVTKNNLEAAEEIVRQLRLRDIGGIIVVDFIDMVLESNRDLVLRRLVECLGRDRTRHQVAEVTSLGLVQMTRKRIGTGLLEAFSENCEHCLGRGLIVHDMPVEQKKVDEAADRRGGGRRNRGRAGAAAGQPAAAKPPTPKDIAAVARPENADRPPLDEVPTDEPVVHEPVVEEALVDEALVDGASAVDAEPFEAAPAAEAGTEEPAEVSAESPAAEPVEEPLVNGAAAVAAEGEAAAETVQLPGEQAEPVVEPEPEPAPVAPAAPKVITRTRRAASRPAGAGVTTLEPVAIVVPEAPAEPEHAPVVEPPKVITRTRRVASRPAGASAGVDTAGDGAGVATDAAHDEHAEDHHLELHVPIKKKGARKR